MKGRPDPGQAFRFDAPPPSGYADALPDWDDDVETDPRRLQFVLGPSGAWADQLTYRPRPPHPVRRRQVDDAESAARDEVGNGGRLLGPVTDLPDGRLALVTTPEGELVALWQPRVGG